MAAGFRHESGRDVYTIVDGEPLSAETRSERSISISRGNWQTRIETSSMLSATIDSFDVTNLLEAFEAAAESSQGPGTPPSRATAPEIRRTYGR
jgi:hypothetical protein